MDINSVLFVVLLIINTFGGLIHWLAPDSGINCIAKMNFPENNNLFKTAVGFLSLEGVERLFSTCLILYVLFNDVQNYDKNITNISRLILVKTIINHVTHKYYKILPNMQNAPGRFKTITELTLLAIIFIY